VEDRFWITDKGRAYLKAEDQVEDVHQHSFELRRAVDRAGAPRLWWSCTDCEYRRDAVRGGGRVEQANMGRRG